MAGGRAGLGPLGSTAPHPVCLFLMAAELLFPLKSLDFYKEVKEQAFQTGTQY